MRNAIPRGFFLVILLLGLLAWSPWVTADFARQRATSAFTSAWDRIADGCGFNCTGCGVKSVEKAAFGCSVKIEYACGMLPADLPEYHQTRVIFISAIGTVHNLPAP